VQHIAERLAGCTLALLEHKKRNCMELERLVAGS